MKGKTKRILVIVVKWRHRANGLFFQSLQEIAVEFVYSWQQKIKNFYIKDDSAKLWVEVIIVTFFNAVATVDALTASNNDANFVETQTIHFAWLLIVVSFWENKQTRLRFLALANFIFCLPPQIPREIAFILSPKARAKMAVLVKSN